MPRGSADPKHPVFLNVLESIGLSKTNAEHAYKSLFPQGIPDLETVFLQYGTDSTALHQHFIDNLENTDDSEKFVSTDTYKLMQLNKYFLFHDNIEWNEFTTATFRTFQKDQLKPKPPTAAGESPGGSPPTPGGTPDTPPPGGPPGGPPGVPPAPTIATDLDFPDKTLELDNDGIRTRAHPSPTFNLKPHPLWRSKYAHNVRSKINMTTFQDTQVALNSDDPAEVWAWYNRFQYLCSTVEVDLCPSSAFKPSHALWPCNRFAEIIFECNTIIHLKLTSPGTLNLKNPTIEVYYNCFLDTPESKLNAYSFLHALLSFIHPKLQRTIPTNPTLEKAGSIGKFGSQLLKYFQNLARMGHNFNSRAQSEFFLQELRLNKVDVDIYDAKLHAIPAGTEIPHDLTLPALTVAIQGSKDYTPPVTPFIHRVNRRNPYNPKGDSAKTTKTDTESGKPTTIRPFYTAHAGQCDACGMWGHKVENCRAAAQWMLIHQYHQEHPDQMMSNSQRWRQLNDRSTKRTIAHHLQRLHPDIYDGHMEDDIINNMSDVSSNEPWDFY